MAIQVFKDRYTYTATFQLPLFASSPQMLKQLIMMVLVVMMMMWMMMMVMMMIKMMMMVMRKIMMMMVVAAIVVMWVIMMSVPDIDGSTGVQGQVCLHNHLPAAAVHWQSIMRMMMIEITRLTVAAVVMVVWMIVIVV